MIESRCDCAWHGSADARVIYLDLVLDLDHAFDPDHRFLIDWPCKGGVVLRSLLAVVCYVRGNFVANLPLRAEVYEE